MTPWPGWGARSRAAPNAPPSRPRSRHRASTPPPVRKPTPGRGSGPSSRARIDAPVSTGMRFLSPEWVDAFNEALVDVVIAPPVPDAGLAVRDGRFTLAQVVTAAPGGDVQTTFEVHEGRATMT